MPILADAVIPADLVTEIMGFVPTIGTTLFQMYPVNVFIVLAIIGGIVALVGKGKRAIRR